LLEKKQQQTKPLHQNTDNKYINGLQENYENIIFVMIV
jgi:hypothetical protein